MNKRTLGIVVLALALVAWGSWGLTHSDPATGQSLAPAVDAPPVSDMPAPQLAQLDTADGGTWMARGLCYPMVVNHDLIKLVLDPGVVGGLNEDDPPLAVEVADCAASDVTCGLAIGPYTVTVDSSTRTVTVDGPDPDVMQRDIDRCIGGGEATSYASAGIWRYTDAGWRYVDLALDR